MKNLALKYNSQHLKTYMKIISCSTFCDHFSIQLDAYEVVDVD